MIFDKVTVEDIPQLHELVETCYRGDIARNGWTHESDIVEGIRTTEEFLKEEISGPGGSYLKHCDDNGKIIGCVYIKVNTQEKEAYVGKLCVYPTLQSQGLGKKLMTAAESIAKKAGCTKLCIEVITVRKELINWYEKIGFKYVGQNAPFPAGSGTPKIFLELGSWEKRLD